MRPPGSVGLVFHPEKPAIPAIRKTLRWLAERARLVVLGDHPLSRRELERLGAEHVAGPRVARLGLDLVVSFGGDGTLLHAAHDLRYHPKTLLLGLNYGHLGFLTEGDLDEGLELLQAIWSGEAWIDRRRLLHLELERGGQVLWRGEALNDVVIRQGRMMRSLRARFFVDQVAMASVVADGFVIASPTGSTAYALSAGGPILHPRIECFEVTPIAPHSMNSRTIVVHDLGVIGVVLDSAFHQAHLYADGRVVYDLVQGDRVEVKASRRRVRFVRVRKHQYYHTLREKLGWHRDAEPSER